MAGAKWDGVKSAAAGFLAAPESAFVDVALNLFPLDNNNTCDSFAYVPPLVPFGANNAAAVNAALMAALPNGFSTPIYPALGGALLALGAESARSATNAYAALLITDGQPVGPTANCGGVDPEDPTVIAAQAAIAATQTPPRRTFVVGLPGANAAVASQIASGGHTGTALIVSALDIAGELASALATIRTQAHPCAFELPAAVLDGTSTLDRVNLTVTPDGGETSTLPRSDDCVAAGWKYDSNNAPTRAVLCAATCNAARADAAMRFEFALGCATQTGSPP